MLTKDLLKDKLIKILIFRAKIKKKNTIKNLYNADFEDVLMLYVDSLPLPKTLQDCHNQFAWLKRCSRSLVNVYYEAKQELDKTKIDYNKFIKKISKNDSIYMSDREKDIAFEYINSIDNLEYLIEQIEERIIRFDTRLAYICQFYDREKLSLHDFCQLLGINYINAQQNIKDELAHDDKYYNHIFKGIEDDGEIEGWKSNRNGMPLFDLVHANFMILLSKNKDMKEKVDDFIMHDLGLAEHMVKINIDDQGNEVVEKYYPPLKVLK
jgi:hypothetical protein